MVGEHWHSIKDGGVFASHGNHTQYNCGSQTLIIITATVMVEQLFILSMDVYIDSIGVEFFTITIQDLLVLKLVLKH